MDMKKILYVHQVSSVGGASYCLLSIIKGLNREKYSPSVLLKGEGPLADEFRKLNVTVYIMPELCAIPYNKSLLEVKTWIGYAEVAKGCRKFERFLSNHDFDIVYLNNMMLYPYLKKIKDSKSIIHVREHWPLNEHKLQLCRAQKTVHEYATRVVAINNYSASMFPQSFDKTDIVYDWIDFKDRFKPYSFESIFGEPMEDKKVYLFTGGSNWTKGPETVVKTFTEQIKDKDARLLILGMKQRKTTGGIKGALKRILRVLGRKDPQSELNRMISADGRIRCLPGIYELKDIIEQSYCMLSYFAIPHANLALAESTILGTPVVAAKTSESLEYSEDGSLAVLYPFGDKAAFAEAIKYLNAHYTEIKSNILRGKSKVELLFNPERNIAVLDSIYDKTVNS